MPQQHPTGGRDLFEAVQMFLDARGRVCGVCTGESPKWDGHDANPPCESFALDVLRQRFAEVRPVLGESDEVTRFRVVRNLFDDVSRTLVAEARPGDPIAARFDDLPPEAQGTVITSLGSILASIASVSQSAARDAS